MEFSELVEKLVDIEEKGKAEVTERIIPRISSGFKRVFSKKEPKKPEVGRDEELIPVYENGYLVDYEIVSKVGFKIAGRDYENGW